MKAALWIDDIDKAELQVITLRFTRVVFGVSSSPFLLNATIKQSSMNSVILPSHRNSLKVSMLTTWLQGTVMWIASLSSM